MGGPSPIHTNDGSNTTGSSSKSWKINPSDSDMIKYNIVRLPDNFEPTQEEKDLMDMYETVKQYEKEAARINEQAAKDKLFAADAKYKQSLAGNNNDEDGGGMTDNIMGDDGQEGDEAISKIKSQKKRRKKKRKVHPNNDDVNMVDDNDEGDYDDDDTMDSEDDDEDHAMSIRERREAKLREMKEKVEDMKQTDEVKAAEAEEAMRQKLLEVNEDALGGDVDGTGPIKKAKIVNADDNKSSLIANLNVATPPHDFSKKLDLKSWQGKVLFPLSKEDSVWKPPEESLGDPNEGALEIVLEDFDMSEATKGINNCNNTIAIKFAAPIESKRFSLNIAAPGHGNYYNVLFHFNPRQFEQGGKLIMNDKKEGIWGQGLSVPLSQVPLIFGEQSSTLIIQINGDGFDVFIKDKHCARLEHRSELPDKKGPLYLQFPATDDYGSPENWSVFKVWWGHKKVMGTGDLSGVAGVNAFSDNLHPRKLFISGLPRISTEAEVDIRRAELERAFRKYGGDRGVTVTVPTNKAFAFVEVETERQADLALLEMTDQYSINRARRTRYEALQEERAAAEASNAGQENKEWD